MLRILSLRRLGWRVRSRGLLLSRVRDKWGMQMRRRKVMVVARGETSMFRKTLMMSGTKA